MTPPTAVYTLSLHDALPISRRADERARPGDGGDRVRKTAVRPSRYVPDRLDPPPFGAGVLQSRDRDGRRSRRRRDRKSTRLNSSHPSISYAVFCLKKKTP